MIGELLYQLSQMEERSAPVIQRYVERATATQAGVTVTALTNPVPLDKYLIVSAACLLATSGAAQTTQFLTIGMQTPGLAGIGLARLVSPSALLQQALFGQWEGVLLSPGDVMTGSATFSAAANPNQITLDVIGLLIPKGNLQIR